MNSTLRITSIVIWTLGGAVILFAGTQPPAEQTHALLHAAVVLLTAIYIRQHVEP